MNKWLVRLENVVILIVGLLVYGQLEFNWWLFLVLFLTPDISMIGYIKNTKIGSIVYNTAHNYALAMGLIGLGYAVWHNDLVTMYGLILLCHIGLDRALGFGLKYPTYFKDSHIQRL